jgi:hypothetical protein
MGDTGTPSSIWERVSHTGDPNTAAPIKVKVVAAEMKVVAGS